MKKLKALYLLKTLRDDYIHSELDSGINEAIAELEAIKSNINSSIEEIEWALAKPEYAEDYLNNALKFLKEEI